METVTECMAELFNKKGHECIVVTPVPWNEKDTYSFKVHRAPGILAKIRLTLWSDLVISKGSSLPILIYAKMLLKPFVWIHSGYQASCIDGLGWVDGEPAPMKPVESIKFYYKKRGFFYAFYEAFKLYIRRFASNHLVTMNVAVSDWVAMRQPFKKQIRIYNPFPIYRFMDYNYTGPINYDFVYLGRLVSEKGLPTLINAFNQVQQIDEYANTKLLIIGDGDWKNKLENMARGTIRPGNIYFAGRKTGEELTNLIYQSHIAIVPSEWEEPMGGVALELLASGRAVIISEKGGLAECVGEAGLVFPNGDAGALASRMLELLSNKESLESKKAKSREQIVKFNPEIFVDQYIDLFNNILKKAYHP